MSTGTRLLAFAASLLIAFGAGAAVGAVAGPIDVGGPPPPAHSERTLTCPTSKPGARPTEIRLDIGGMTCASCAARIEKKLNRMDGVTATVNYATEKANVHVADSDAVTVR